MAEINLSVEFNGSTVMMNRELIEHVGESADEFREECHRAVDAAVNALEATLRK